MVTFNGTLRLNMELDLQSLFRLLSRDRHSCTHWLRPLSSPLLPHLDPYTREPLVSQDRHLFITPWWYRTVCANKRFKGENIFGGVMEYVYVWTVYSVGPTEGHWAHSPRSDYKERTSSCPVQQIKQCKCIKLTLDTNIQLTLYKALHLSERPMEIIKLF